ncbi:MAG TPA: MXAN_5187 C-terminal domain-containing protein [Kofleriaceae bacterium]|nr:MXAN_5187 C-terminal domain-containing protein [Kofleriaceae bacterium]
MSRTVIAAVVAAVIAVLTGIAFFVTSTSFEDRARRDADAKLARAYQVVQQLNQLEGIDVSNKAERLAAEREFVSAIKTDSPTERQGQARIGFQRFTADEKQGAVRPDIIALLDASNRVLAMNGMQTVTAGQWKTDKGESIIPAVNEVLGKKMIISDIWNYGGKGIMKVGVAPVIDPDAPVSAQDPDGQVIIGAIVVAYAQTAKEAQQDRNLLGTEIAYYDNRNVVATSFTTGAPGEEATTRARQLTELLRSGGLSEGGAKQRVSIGGVDYLAAAVKMPRSSTRKLPPECTKDDRGPCYPAMTAGAVVLAPIADPGNAAGTVKLFIGLLGAGALAIALLGLYLVHRRLIAQVDQIELGVTDIINGNVDRTFRPVGLEFDGLANGLNVMLARLLGRPEPGEEEVDDEGNPILQGRVEFEDGDGSASAAADPDLAALAQESEPDYYKRVYTEYLAARRATGNPDEVSFENFIAKLKVNEGKLRAQYQCRAVRFRLVVNDGKVTLKPVPIYA